MFVVKWSDIHYKRLMLMIMVMMVKGDEFFFFIRIRLSFTQSGGNFFSFIYEQRLYIYIQYIHWENISYNQSINQFLVIKFPYHYCHQFIANLIGEWKRKNPINWSIIEMPEMKFFFYNLYIISWWFDGYFQHKWQRKNKNTKTRKRKNLANIHTIDFRGRIYIYIKSEKKAWKKNHQIAATVHSKSKQSINHYRIQKDRYQSG